MNRADYLRTIDGLKGRRLAQRRNQLSFMFSGQEPKSKKSIAEIQKADFQRTIVGQLKTRNRRCFKAPVALEFDFFPAENDPPAIHSLPKNYIDLLMSPVSALLRETSRKRILIDDDRQVQFLAVRYHIGHHGDRPDMWLRIAPYRDFIAVIEMIDQINRGEILGSNSNSNRTYARNDFDEFHGRNTPINFKGDAIDRLREFESEKTLWISQIGLEAYQAMRELYIVDAQVHFLELFALSPRKLVNLLAPLFSSLPTEFSATHALQRNMLISDPFAIDLKHSDLKEGESVPYKKFVDETMANFRSKYAKLFPLRVQAGITILYQPPAAGGIDLDNLARRIVPFVNDKIKPPSNHIMMVNPDNIRDQKHREWFIEKQNDLKRMPKFSISHYQVIQLPRLSNDSVHGFVRLILEPGGSFDTIWSRTEDYLDKTIESMTAR